MQGGVKIGLGVAALLVAMVGVRVGLIYRHNHEAAAPSQPEASHWMKLDEDSLIFLRKERPDSLKDARKLIGKTIWVSAGGQMDFYKDSGKHVDYAKPLGTLKGADPLVITDVFEQVPPKSGRAVSRISAGQRHVLLAFTMPKNADPKALFAAPVGHFVDGLYEFYNDEIFFYDDPHGLYKHWGPGIWAHIENHEVAPGMTENQCMMALGQVIEPHGDTAGNRRVTFNNDNHPVDIEFSNGKATRITPAS